MPLIIKNIQVNWSWSGDTEALKGFNVCLCKSTDTPLTATTAFVYISDINSRSYIFRNITIDTGVTYEPYVQAVYDGKDSDWVKTSGGSIADDGINTIPIKLQVDTAATTATWDGVTGKPDTLSPPIGSGLYLSSTRMGYYDTGDWKTYIDNAGNFKLGNVATGKGIDWNQNNGTLTIKGTLDAQDINASGFVAQTINIADNAVTIPQTSIQIGTTETSYSYSGSALKTTMGGPCYEVPFVAENCYSVTVDFYRSLVDFNSTASARAVIYAPNNGFNSGIYYNLIRPIIYYRDISTGADFVAAWNSFNSAAGGGYGISSTAGIFTDKLNSRQYQINGPGTSTIKVFDDAQQNLLPIGTNRIYSQDIFRGTLTLNKDNFPNGFNGYIGFGFNYLAPNLGGHTITLYSGLSNCFLIKGVKK